MSDPQPDPNESWAHSLGHLLWEVSARTSLLGDAALSYTPLTRASIGILDQIATRPGITIAEITRRAPTSQQAISQVVARLEKLGYVERRLAHGRGVALHVTEAGVQARVEGNALEDDFEAELRDALGAGRYDRLRELLEETNTIVKRLGAEQKAPG